MKSKNVSSVIKDSVSNSGLYVLQLMIGIFTVPVFLSTFGEDLYGVYLLSLGLASSLLFLEFGSGRALIRYTAEYLVDKDLSKYQEAIYVCFLLTSFSCVLLPMIFGVVSFFRHSLFHIPESLSYDAKMLFAGSGVYAMAVVVSQFSSGILVGAGIFYRRNLIAFIQVFLKVVIIVAVYYRFIGMFAVLVSETLLVILTILVDLIFIISHRELVSAISFKHRITKGANILRSPAFKYAIQTFYISTIGFFSSNVDKIILAMLLDIKFVTIYTIITKPYIVCKSFLSRIYVIFQHKYVQLLSVNGKSKLLDFIGDLSKISSRIIFFFSCMGIILLPYLFQLWVGDSYNSYVIYAQMLIFGLSVRSASTVFYQGIYAVGETKPLVRIELVLVSINFISSLLLTLVIGMPGVIIGSVIQILLAVPFILRIAKQYFKDLNDTASIISEQYKIYYISFVFGLATLLIVAKLDLSKWPQYVFPILLTLIFVCGYNYKRLCGGRLRKLIKDF